MMTQEQIDSIRERMCEECCAFSTLSQLVKDEVCNTGPLNELEASAEPEIIRCKDCKYRDADDFCTGRGYPCDLVPDDGFCDKGAKGEKMEMEVDE